MKNSLLSFCFLVLVSCGQTPQQTAAEAVSANATYYGEKISADSVINIDELAQTMGDKTEISIKVKGTVDNICQKKGCWMDLRKSDGTTMRVTFKDYGFFMPKDGAGKTAIIRGVAKIEETSVADLQEYARDAGKSEAEVNAITNPEKELVFEADGVILQ